MAEILLGKLHGPSGFERAVVIKRILPHLATQTQFREMFLHEAQTLSNLRHPNIVQVQELGQDGDELFLVLEYLDGESAFGLMRRLVRSGESLPFSLGMHIVAEAAAGLHAAHELTDDDGRQLGLVHRDVSPQNIHVLYNGQVKLLDFGIAKAADSTIRTEAGQLKGKFAYMSPEQCRGDSLDRRSDVFSLGIVLYELTTGRRLFARKSDLATMKAICEERIVRPSRIVPGYPKRLEDIVMRSLTRLREERFQTAIELRRELFGLRRELSGDPVPESVLAGLMKRAFDDRIAEKKEMLRRIRAGSDVAVVPAAEADPSIDIPIVIDDSGITPEPSARPHTLDASAPPSPIHSDRRPAAGRKAAILGGLVALLGLGGLAAWQFGDTTSDQGSAATAGTATHREVPTGAGSSEDEPETSAETTIEIHVDSTPEGAEIRVGDELRGQTPAVLSFEQSPEPITLRLSQAGYEAYEEVVVPDVTQRLRLTLTRSRTRGRPTMGASMMTMMSGTASSMSEGFRRFD